MTALAHCIEGSQLWLCEGEAKKNPAVLLAEKTVWGAQKPMVSRRQNNGEKRAALREKCGDLQRVLPSQTSSEN